MEMEAFQVPNNVTTQILKIMMDVRVYAGKSQLGFVLDSLQSVHRHQPKDLILGCQKLQQF